MLISLAACAVNEGSISTDTSDDGNSETTTLTDGTTTKNNGNSDGTPSITPIEGGVVSSNESYVVKEGGVVALEVYLSLPVADISGNEAVREKLASRLQDIKSDITDHISDLEDYYKSTIALGSTHLFTPRITVSFELNHFTEKAMSISFTITEVNGYGVTTSTSRHYNYEFDFASKVTFASFFSDTDAVTAAVCDKVSQTPDLYPNAKELIPSLIGECWYFSDGKIIFTFNPYDIAPASSGYISVSFSADELADHMSEYGKDLMGIG